MISRTNHPNYDRKELLFSLSNEEWSRLESEGRRLRSERNVVYPPGPWSDEQHVRYAIQKAMSAAYAT